MLIKIISNFFKLNFNHFEKLKHLYEFFLEKNSFFKLLICFIETVTNRCILLLPFFFYFFSSKNTYKIFKRNNFLP